MNQTRWSTLVVSVCLGCGGGSESDPSPNNVAGMYQQTPPGSSFYSNGHVNSCPSSCPTTTSYHTGGENILETRAEQTVGNKTRDPLLDAVARGEGKHQEQHPYTGPQNPEGYTLANRLTLAQAPATDPLEFRTVLSSPTGDASADATTAWNQIQTQLTSTQIQDLQTQYTKIGTGLWGRTAVVIFSK